MERNKVKSDNGWIICEIENSSRILQVSYYPVSKTLSIVFHGNQVYCYKHVPKDIFEELVSAESVGKAFQTLIYKQYPYYKI